MKVVHVTLRFDAPGGVETNVREVAKGLLEAGDDVRVFASDLYDEGRWERRTSFAPTVAGVPVRWFPVEKRVIPFLTMPMMGGVIDALAAERWDVIHAHSHRYGHVLQAAVVARRRHTPFVVSTHYHPADRGEPALKTGLLRCQDVAFGMSAYRVADALVVETEREASLVREFAPAGRIHVIPPGIDLEAWSHPEQDVGPPGLPDRYILYAGRIAPNKRLPVLLRAFAQLPKEGRPKLVLLGRDWGDGPGLQQLAEELGIGPEVRWTGHLELPAEYRAVMRRASVFVLPSEWEAFGLVLLEAMAARVPIVASSVGGVPEVLEGGVSGRLVPYGDVPALASAIGTLLADGGARAQLVAAGSRRVSSLTWANTVDRHRALYRELAAT
jgi:glycosyltransferase involved in cell wall biosynthesis